MNTTNRIVEALNQAEPHELLSAFVGRFNDQSTQLDEVTDQRDRLERANVADQHELAQLREQLAQQVAEITSCHEAAQRRTIEAHTKIDLLQRQLAHDTGSGLYHNGEHHLIIWPQKTKFQRPDGSTFEARSLLYMHQSGRGGLFTYSEEGGTVFAASPKPGLKPSKEVQEFAHNWLFKVNALQDGVVHETDMVPVDFNGYASQQAA